MHTHTQREREREREREKISLKYTFNKELHISVCNEYIQSIDFLIRQHT